MNNIKTKKETSGKEEHPKAVHARLMYCVSCWLWTISSKTLQSLFYRSKPKLKKFKPTIH